ncbi:MAG TPA: thioredoxin domain-containing protein [Candidatus Magasanikbacteria bacterium]|nr:thioredoxin domain-containing protein [Candidatus Magasanikbacteria bacterium]
MQNFDQNESAGISELANREEPNIKWYKTRPGVIFLVVLSLITVIFTLFAVFVAYYAIKIKLGFGDELQRKFAPKTETGEVVRLDLSKYLRTDNPSFGKMDAPITVVMYYDLMCPVCAKANPDFQAMMSKYEPVVRVVFKNFPIESAHPGTMELSEKAMCAHEQGKFIDFISSLYSGQKFDAENISGIVQKIKMDAKKFKLCVDEARYRDTVEKDAVELSGLRLRGTPTFFVNGLRVEGAISAENWDRIIINELTRLNTAQK